MLAVTASTSGRPAPPPSSSPSPARRRPPPGVRLRRGDLPTGRRQPWLVDYETSLAGLGLVTGRGSEGDAPVAVLLSVTTAGAGFFVRGRLDCPGLALPCEVCGVTVPVPLGGGGDAAAVTFDVWLDPSDAGADGLAAADGGDADAVAWPPHASAVDLTQCAAGAAQAALPGRVVCGAPACAGGEWVAGEGGVGAGAGSTPTPPAGAAFGRLAGLKARLERGQ